MLSARRLNLIKFFFHKVLDHRGQPYALSAFVSCTPCAASELFLEAAGPTLKDPCLPPTHLPPLSRRIKIRTFFEESGSQNWEFS